MAKTSVAVQARRRAREAKAKLDAERAARDKKIEEAVTAFYLGQAQEAEAATALAAAQIAQGDAIRILQALDEPLEIIAALCGIEPSDVRRLAKLEAPSVTETGDDSF